MRRTLFVIQIALSVMFMAAQPASAQFVQDLVIGDDSYSFHGSLGGSVKTFQSDKEALDVVRGIMDSMGLPLRFDVRAGSVDNASAILTKDGRRLIVYNIIFMEEIKKKTGEYWSLISIMAHEIGHHLSFHMSEQIDDHTAELEADYFSGFVLGKLGAEFDASLAAMRELSSPLPSKTHPKKDDRLQAIAVGWKAATANRRADPSAVAKAPVQATEPPQNAAVTPGGLGQMPDSSTGALPLAFNPSAVPSFNCVEYQVKPIGHRDRNPQTDLMCIDIAIAQVDNALGQTFRAYLNRLPRDRRKSAIEMQKLWILERNARCPASWQDLQIMERRNAISQCLANLTRSRIVELGRM